jgi:hypothetical protein
MLPCDHNRGGSTLVNLEWSYIHYPDGTEKLYQLGKDREEWSNLAGQEVNSQALSQNQHHGPTNSSVSHCFRTAVSPLAQRQTWHNSHADFAGLHGLNQEDSLSCGF